MALVTVQRDSSTSGSECSDASCKEMTVLNTEQEDASNDDAFQDLEEEEEKKDEVQDIVSPTRSSKSKLKRQGSVSENFFAVKGAALILPRQTSLAVNLPVLKQFGGELQTHLHAIFHHLREQDSIKLAVRLESWNEEHRRYLVIVSTTGRQDTEENIIVGCDFPTKESKVCTIGLVLPIWCDTTIQLDGDGGYKVLSHEKTHTFKPVSVQAMWSALQALHKCKDTAQKHNYYEGSLFLTWTCYYTSKIKSNRVYINEWEYSEDLWTRKPNYFEMKDAERVSVETLIRDRLKQVMMTMDLDNCTCKQVRLELENVIDMDLTAYKRYIDTEMFNILGQMDCPTKILDYLYLGSGWNASNLEELERLGITHILNVTIEVDNFFPDDFTYKNIRLHDLEASNLLQHWHGTWRFIDQAHRSEGKCLVHCKMGISRSSATVAAYLMKERLWTKKKALEFVVGLRSIAHPNPAFLDQLDEYEGMVFASANRHNKLFRSRSESSLSEPSISDDHPVATSPRPAPPPIIQCPDSSEDQLASAEAPDFDLNRRLLDLASLAVPKVSRPKSWSPEEGRACYNPPHSHTDNVLDRSNNYAGGDNIYPKNSSEPGELLIAPSGDHERAQKANQRRANYKREHWRRHTAGTANTPAALMHLDDLAQSEDSVFVHDGNGPFVPAKAWEKSASPPLKVPSARTSSPAAISLAPAPNSLQIEEVDLHSSMVSPRNSPSYKQASGIDIDSLKSRFLDPGLENERQSPPQTIASIPPTAIKAPVPVRQIVADIESPLEETNEIVTKIATTEPEEPSTFQKGHHKTVSLPPADVPSDIQAPMPVFDSPVARARSFSENQITSVKKLVTEIESRYSPDVSLPEETKDEEECTIQRSMSMPSSKRRTASPSQTSACSFVPVTETAAEADPIPENAANSFYIGEKRPPKLAWSENNNSNNNNNNMFTEMVVITDPTEELLSPEPICTDDALKASPKRNTSPKFENKVPKFKTSENNGLSPEKICLTSETDLVQTDLPIIFPSPAATPKSSNKPRGLVSQMVRKLTGKAAKSKSNHPSTPGPVKMEKSPNVTNRMNKLLMGQSELQIGARLARDSYDSGAQKSPKTSPSSEIDLQDSSPQTGRPRCIDITAYTAAPYRPQTGSPPSKVSLNVSDRRVRRSQSERVGVTTRRRSAHYSMISEAGILHHATRCYKSQPELTDTPTTPLPVREMVRTIEAKRSSVHRSSSLPPANPRHRISSYTPNSTPKSNPIFSSNKTLSRSKSTPLLGFHPKSLKPFKLMNFL